ncbi:MAG TPA: hypothetical protein VMV68_05530 [Spirochaetia bacterium]|nr:hypothetical protein [Spirochaetia bacterium]
MARTLALPVFFALAALGSLSAQPALFAKSDALYSAERYAESTALLQAALPGASTQTERAHIYWRLSRDAFDATYALPKDAPASQLLHGYELAESYADSAIGLDPLDAKGYYWKAAAVGQLALLRNVFAAFRSAGMIRDLLSKAAHLDPSDGEIWYVLAQLYSRIPGAPLSFGNTASAVSFGRKGLDARIEQEKRGEVSDVPFDYYNQLSIELARRDWSAARRQSEHAAQAKQYAQTTDVVEKNAHYEGAVAIPDLSDRQEAIQIARWVAAQLETKGARTRTQRQDLALAQADLRKWER